MTIAQVLKVAVIGAECTGKTTLCRTLAQSRGGLWVPEYLREFVDTEGRPPLVHEQATVVATQLAREQANLLAALEAGHGLLAFDSVPLATALYSRLYFSDDRLLAAATTHQCRYDITLVTDIDLPWEPDGAQRDGPAMRARFHEMLIDWLSDMQLPFTLVQGQDQARADAAAAALDLR